MNDKILILGTGFIGSKVRDTFDCNISGRIITSFKEAEEEIDKFKPKILINCIGYTGLNVDYCERDKDNTLIANTFIPIILADVALRRKIRLVHISSGCIFNYDYKKDKPLEEDRLPDYFKLFYSRTKIYSERALEILSDKFNILIVRIRIPLDNRPHTKNLLNKLIKYKKVIDVPNSVTYIPDFLKALKHLVRIKATGIYNVVNKGALRYADLMQVYKKYVPEFEYKIIDFKKLNMERTNLILSTKKLEKTKFKVRNINEVLEECVKEYVKY